VSTIELNGERTEVAEGTTVAELVARLDAPARGVAVALDAEVVPRSAWDVTTVADGARVEVLTAIQGG
jgi:sulfur carrier protein